MRLIDLIDTDQLLKKTHNYYPSLDEDGNTDCRGDMFRRFIKKMNLEET